MPEKVFFQCSLPRVGSTLFQNIINQDSRFYASANNGLLNLVTASRQNFSDCVEFKAQDSELMKKAFAGFCRASMHGFYNAITDKQYALDKSRGNFANYTLISQYYPAPKIICFVRNMPDIFASLEKLFRKNQHKSSALVNHAIMQGITTAKRTDIWHRSFMPMMDIFYQSVVSGLDKEMLFIKYESFCQFPEMEMKRVYDYLGIPHSKHNFDTIEQTVKENEEVYDQTFTGMLKIRSKLDMNQPDAMKILGNDVYESVMKLYNDYNSYFGYA